MLFAVLMQLDGRTLPGRNVWTKPWKFATSIAIFTGTPFDSTVFAVVGVGVTITISSVAVAYVLRRVVERPPDLAPAYRRG